MTQNEAIDIYIRAKDLPVDAVYRDDLYKENLGNTNKVIEAIQNAGTMTENLGSTLRSMQIISMIIVLTEMLNKED